MTRAKLALAVATGPMYRQGDIHEWRTVAMKRAGFSIAMVVFVTPAFGQGAQGSSALALAALVAEHDVAMAPGDRSIVAGLLAGQAPLRYPVGRKIEVAAKSIMRRDSDMAIARRSCALTFGARAVELTGRLANELHATIAVAGMHPDEAAGSIYRRCTA
jgi:hypothetical protein